MLSSYLDKEQFHKNQHPGGCKNEPQCVGPCHTKTTRNCFCKAEFTKEVENNQAMVNENVPTTDGIMDVYQENPALQEFKNLDENAAVCWGADEFRHYG